MALFGKSLNSYSSTSIVEGYAYAAGTIINALATGIGCAFGLNLRTRVKISFERDLRENIIYEGKERIESPVVDRVMKPFGKKAVVRIESEIPRQSGLGSSSAFMNALLVALFKAMKQELDAYRILTANARISLEVGISYTGAFDDAAASLLGGFVLSNNTKMRLLKWEKVNGEALILIPPWKRGKVLLNEIRRNTKLIEMAINEALKGNYKLAMLHNSQHYCKVLDYPFKPIEEAEKLDISAGLSGNGPTYIAFGSKEEIMELESIWSGYGEIVRTKLISKPVDDLIIPGHLFIPS
jgi:shikimate kinase